MASQVMIAIAEEKASARMHGAAFALAEAFGISAMDMPTNARDPYYRAQQLDAVGDFLLAVLGELSEPLEVSADIETDNVIEGIALQLHIDIAPGLSRTDALTLISGAIGDLMEDFADTQKIAPVIDADAPSRKRPVNTR
jgi:hypothetical protein